MQIIREAFSLIYSMNLRLPTRFVLLDKALATVGSVGVDLYPDFNVFEVAKPYARSLMLERFTARRVLGRVRREGWELATSRPSCRTRSTTRSSRCATGRSRSASSTRASTSSCTGSTR